MKFELFISKKKKERNDKKNPEFLETERVLVLLSSCKYFNSALTCCKSMSWLNVEYSDESVFKHDGEFAVGIDSGQYILVAGPQYILVV